MNMDEPTKANYRCFLLCKECYWSASAMDLRACNRIIKCPACNDAYVKLISIFDNETNRIDYNKRNRFATESNTHIRVTPIIV
jgi:hypothetical protein